MMDEILLIDKPKDWTSFDVVGKIRSRIRSQTGQRVKVGHAGSLDPLATGLLIVLVGRATKKQDTFMKQDKVYEVVVRLGQTSDTDDDEGQKTNISDRVPTENEVKNALQKFIGEISQTPPAYSAVKINGQRAYKLARAGKEVNIEPRRVKIYEITNVNYSYPEISFAVKVSSGTYIRSLASDIGKELKTGAFVLDLRRTKIGDYSVEQAQSLNL